MQEQPSVYYPIPLQIMGNNYAKIAETFATAQHSLTTNQLKAWIVFIATLDSENDNGENVYQFNAFDLADRLGVDKRKARGTIVAKIFRELSRKNIEISGEKGTDGEQNIYSANFVSGVIYDKTSHLLCVEIPKTLRPYLFALKQGTFMSINTEHITALDSTPAIRTYIYLKNLERIGQFTVDLDSFRKGIGATSPYYDSFKQLKAKVIKTAIREIRKHTDYKDFFIEDNGSPGRKATMIRFGFTKTIEEDYFMDVNPTRAAICKRYPKTVQIVMRLAIDKGFDPAYIGNKFDGIPNDRIIANFNYVLTIISKDERKGSPKAPDVYGKYFITSVVEGWAEHSNQSEAMLQKNKNRVANQKLQERMKEVQEEENVANNAVYIDRKAKEYLATLSSDDFRLNEFIHQNMNALTAMAGKNGFNILHAMSHKKTYREYKILVSFISAKMALNEIEIPKTLFETNL